MSDAESHVRIERDFDADIETVWNMWVDPDLFASWYGPMGFTVPSAEMEFEIGGTRTVCMEMATPDQTVRMWFTGQYKLIDAPHRLVYTESICDEDGHVVSPQSIGMPEGTPEVTEIHVTLTEIGGKTRMVMEHRGVPAGSPGEGGWRQAFDKLAGELAKG